MEYVTERGKKAGGGRLGRYTEEFGLQPYLRRGTGHMNNSPALSGLGVHLEKEHSHWEVKPVVLALSLPYLSFPICQMGFP